MYLENREVGGVDMTKGTLLIIARSKACFQVVGFWQKDVVLAPITEGDDQVLIYTQGELKELLDSGYFRKLHPVKEVGNNG